MTVRARLHLARLRSTCRFRRTNSSENGVGGINWHATTLTIPANHWYYVEVLEAISISSNPEYTQYYTGFTQYNGTVAGPFGVGPESFLKTLLGFQTPDGWYETPLTAVDGQPSRARKLIKGPATVWIKRDWIPGSGSCVSGTPLGPWDLPDCPTVDGGLYYHSAPAYLLGGVHEVRIVPAAVSLSVTATPNNPWVGDSVTFDAQSSTGSSVVVTDWIYRPDAGGSISGPGTCQPPSDPCKYAPSSTGTMYVNAQVGPSGAVEQARVRVTVREDSLLLVAVPTTVEEGQEVTFTASTRSGQQPEVLEWSWSGTAPAFGLPITSANSCGTNNPCVMRVYETGTMTVRARVRGVERTATATVTVTPCPPTGDHKLDSPEVRNGLRQLLRASNPGAVPGLTGPGRRHERTGLIYQRVSDNSYFLLDHTDPSSTQCLSIRNAPPPDPSEFRVSAGSHVHPSLRNDDLYGCPPDPKTGQRFAQQLSDTLTVLQVGRSATGGSDVDWEAVVRGFLDEYIITKGGNVIRLNAQTGNSNSWRVRQNGSICLDQ